MGSGKGSGRRPSAIGREEEELRWKLAMGKITFDQYSAKVGELFNQGKITRDGKVVIDGY